MNESQIPGKVASHGTAAVIFDMDGVLADTEPIQQRALQEMLASRGLRITDAEYADFMGLDNTSFWQGIVDRFALPGKAENYAAEHEDLLVPMLVAVASAADGVHEVIRLLHLSRIPVAVASSSLRRVMDCTLSTIGLGDAFSAVIAGEDVSNGKPHPDIYILAAERLGVSPSACVAIEDSRYGIAAAKAAGMRTVGVLTRYTTARDLPADLVVNSVAELVARDGCMQWSALGFDRQV